MEYSVRQIRSFIAVARARSFTRAAAILHVSQPTLTVQIRRLEETLCVRLLDRDSRTVDLTRIGRELLPALERIVQDLDAALLGAQSLADATRGIVRLAVLPSFASGPLPDAIRTFRDTRPGVSFRLHDVVAGRGLPLLVSEEVDLAILGGEPGASDVDVLARSPEQLVVVHPARHPVGRVRRLTAKSLARYPLVLMHAETSVRAVTDIGFSRAGVSVNVAAEATYMMTAVAMVRAGLGLAILPASAREIAAEPTVAARAIDDPAFVRPVVLAKKRHRTLPPSSDAFARHLAECMGGASDLPCVP